MWPAVQGGNHAIKAFVNTGPGDASVTYDRPGQLAVGLSSTGTNSTDIQAESVERKRHHRCFGEHVVAYRRSNVE